MEYYNLEINDVLKKLKTNEMGLTPNETNERLKLNGKNKIIEEKKESNLKKFINEFKDIMIIILIIAAIISFIISIINKESYIDSIIILAIVVLNAILGFIQELKADKAIESLKKLQVSKVKVKRDNKVIIVNSEDVVKGDILILEAGDNIVADCRVIWEASLKVNEASLTGESLAVGKSIQAIEGNVPISERNNMIYSGTHVVYGKCHAVVCETGMNTQFGFIAKSLTENKKEITPLQKKINGISKFLSIVIAVIIILIFILSLIKGIELSTVIMLSISLAVAAIPEGLPAVITIILSLGMKEMSKKNAIVRKMSSVETLGCTEIICSDKTGTITQNKMKVREIYFNNKICNVSDFDKDNILFKSMILNNDVEKNGKDYIGDPTEIALYEILENILDIQKIRNNNIRINELPFDSDRKMMSTINKNNDDIKLYTKGSFDSLIKHCTYIYENNKIVKLTKEKKEQLKNIETEESNKAYRILAFAYKNIEEKDIINENIEDNLIFIGMTAMIDPPRKDVKNAIIACKSAHIRPIMITGDSLSTACAIAKEIGILENNNEAITGAELDKMSQVELNEQVKKYSVYARVSPTNKISIVKAWKNNNKVVAMTGDGVNDAPALKNADIGIGMGITGTEVSKGVSDIILADDSFSTIVTAVKEGRRIFDNIRNVLVYLLTGNISEIIVVFVGMIFGIEIFIPIQLLYINLITDSIPAIALAFEKEGKNIMNREIRKKDSSFFTPFLISKMCISSILKSFAILTIYYINLNLYNIEIASTTAFLTIILLEMIYSLSCRNLKNSIINKDFFKNKYINKCLLGLGIVQILIFTTPVKSIFNIVDISLIQIINCILIVFVVFIVDELSKKLISRTFKD